MLTIVVIKFPKHFISSIITALLLLWLIVRSAIVGRVYRQFNIGNRVFRANYNIFFEVPACFSRFYNPFEKNFRTFLQWKVFSARKRETGTRWNYKACNIISLTSCAGTMFHARREFFVPNCNIFSTSSIFKTNNEFITSQ